MYVSRLVYIVCLLEAVLWFQPNFALSNQRDMAKLLQSQTHKINELAQNAAKESPLSVIQKQLDMIAKEQEMVARENIQVHNMQTALLDKASTKQQTTVDQVQRMPRLLVGQKEDGNLVGNAEGEGKGVPNGAVPLMTNSQAYMIVCCVLAACATLVNGSSPVCSESSETRSEEEEEEVAIAAAIAESAASCSVAMKRSRDNEEDDEEIAKANEEDGKVWRGRKQARLGVQAPSSVHHPNQANKNWYSESRSFVNSRRNCDSEVVASPGVASEECIVSSPVMSMSSDASSPSVSSPSAVSVSSGVFSTLPPELAYEFEAEHSFYFHGIACPCTGSPSSVNVVPSPPPVTPLLHRVVSQPSQYVATIDPAILLDPAICAHHLEQDDCLTSSVSSGQSSEIDDAEDDRMISAPLFGVNMEQMLQDQSFC